MGWGEKGRSRTAACGKHGEWGDGRGSLLCPHGAMGETPNTAFHRVPPPESQAASPWESGAQLGPTPSAPGLRFFSYFFFFPPSLKPPHLSSFRRRAPAGVLLLEGCWVIDLLALLFPLAGVSQVVAVNSSEPRARGGVPVGRAD